jgi:magnesium-transporting ATPase (P-type)
MATFLDVGLVQHFSVIFPILLVFVIVFALLEKSQMLGNNKGLHSLIALSVALMMLFVPGVVKVISLMAPWFVLMFLLVIFFMVLIMSSGTKWDNIASYMSEWNTPHWFFLIIGLIIFIGALASVYGTSMLPYSSEDQVNASATGTAQGTSTDTGNFNQNVGRVIFHPATLGMVFLFMVGSLTIRLLTKN